MFKKKPDKGRRVCFGQLDHKPDLKAHMERLKKTFPGVKFTLERVGREFWVVAPEGTTPNEFDRYTACVRTALTMKGQAFSIALPAGALNLDEGVRAPEVPPQELAVGPYVVVIALFDRGDAMLGQWELHATEWSHVRQVTDDIEKTFEVPGLGSIKDLRARGMKVRMQIQKG
jgi:hypothetical protein